MDEDREPYYYEIEQPYWQQVIEEGGIFGEL